VAVEGRSAEDCAGGTKEKGELRPGMVVIRSGWQGHEQVLTQGAVSDTQPVVGSINRRG